MDLNSMLNQFMCDGNIDQDAVNRMMNNFSGGGFGSIGLIILFIILLCCCCSGGYGQGLPFGNLFGGRPCNPGVYPPYYPNYGHEGGNCYKECCCKCEPYREYDPCDDSGCDCCCSRKKRKKCRKAWRKYKKYRCECACEPEQDCCDSCCEQCCNECLNYEEPQDMPPQYNPYGCGLGNLGGIWCIIIIIILFCCCGGGLGSFLGNDMFRKNDDCCKVNLK